MLLCDFVSSTSYSMPSSPVSTSGGAIDGVRSMSGIIDQWSDQIRKRRKKKKVADMFGIHYYPNYKETNISYDTSKKKDGNINWRKRYERYGLSQKSSYNREKNDLPEYVGHYTINR